MRRLLLRIKWLFCLLMLCTVVLMQAPHAEAEENELLASTLIIEPIISTTVGERIKVDLQLTNLEEQAISNAPLTITLDNTDKRQVRTDEEGKAELFLPSDLPAAEYELKVSYKGSLFYKGALSSRRFKIKPAELQITVVPPLEGMSFEMIPSAVAGEVAVENKLRATSDAEGNVFFSVDYAGTYELKALSEAYKSPEGIEIAFERWQDNVFELERELVIPRTSELEIGFEVSYSISQMFIDLKNQVLPEERIESVRVKSSHGTTHHFEDGKPQMLQANRVVKRRTGLEASPIQYSIEAVYVDGTNVVNRAQQRFLIEKPERWTIQLLLYSGYFEARDALFRFPIGTGIELSYPDGHIEFIEFDENGSLWLPNVARGLYKVQVKLDENHWATRWGYGIAPLTPVALSRDQEVSLLVISLLDIIVAFLITLTIGIGLLYYGRPQWFMWPPPLLLDTAPQPIINPDYYPMPKSKRPITEALYFGNLVSMAEEVDSKQILTDFIAEIVRKLKKPWLVLSNLMTKKKQAKETKRENEGEKEGHLTTAIIVRNSD